MDLESRRKVLGGCTLRLLQSGRTLLVLFVLNGQIGCGSPMTQEAPPDAPLITATDFVTSTLNDFETQAWPRQVETAIEDAERHQAEGMVRAALAPVSGNLLGEPIASVQVAGGMDGANTFLGLIRGEMRATAIFSVMPPEELVETFRITRAVGLFTSTDDCRKEIHKHCGFICSRGQYDRDGSSSNMLLYSPHGKRRDICRLDADIQKYSEKGREGYCNVYQRNPDLCRASSVETGHPIAGCEYFTTDFVARWQSTIHCTLDGVWRCVSDPTLTQCAATPRDPIQPPPPDFCGPVQISLSSTVMPLQRLEAAVFSLNDFYRP